MKLSFDLSDQITQNNRSVREVFWFVFGLASIVYIYTRLDIYSRLPITDKLLLGFKDNMITQDPNVSGTSSTIFQ